MTTIGGENGVDDSAELGADGMVDELEAEHRDGTSPGHDAVAYRERRLGGAAPILDLPGRRPGRAGRRGEDRTVAIAVEAAAVAALKCLAHDLRTTLPIVALSAYKAFLARMTGQRDLVVGTSLAAASPDGTTPAGDGGAGGDGTGVTVLRTVLADDATFRDVITQVRDEAFEVTAVRGVPFGQDLATVDPPFVSAARPVLQTCFSLMSSGPPSGARPADADLTVHLRESGDDLTGEATYPAGGFDDGTIARFASVFGHFMGVLGGAPDERIDTLPLLPDDERRRILDGLNPYVRPVIPYASMSEPFEEQVARTPDALAVVGDDGSLTYAELNARANRLARYLRAAGARPDRFVALCMERSVNLMVALYAIVKTGAAYVPLDPELPDARLAFMLDDAAPIAVLTDRASRDRISEGPWRIISVADDAESWSAEPAANLAHTGCDDDLIYLLYTSGTTGRPKAVAYPVNGALADIFWLQRTYPFEPGDAALLKTSYGFDVSIWELFWPLYFGARVVICPPHDHLDPVRVRTLIERHEVSTLFLVPSMMRPFLDAVPPGACRSLRWMFCGGEPVTPHIRDGFHTRFAGALINCYGPTEAGTVTDMVLPPDPGAPTVPLGRPAANFRTYVLDEHLSPAPIGVPGEVFIGGEVGIARGYHRRPGLTAERFLPDPYGAPGSRMYRTGDLCRYRDDGVLEHLGRIGRQVKIRGMRIEPAEIEAVFAEFDDVARCVVTMSPSGEGRIAAFVLPREGRSPTAPALLARAREQLPSHMVPATLTVVDEIPSFVNGKIDFGALLGLMDESADVDAHLLTPPDGELETRLAGIFCRVLDLPAVDVTANFFALGGHSLLAIKLIELCGAETGVRPSVRDLFANSSVRELAEWAASSPPAHETPLVPLVTAPSRPLIVFVHAASGSALPFLPVARLLGDAFSVSGLQSPPDAPHGSIEDMAAHYVTAVDEIRGDAPVAVAGWSMGGCVAVEMARRWQRLGRPVSATLLLDTWAPPAFMRTPAAEREVHEAIRALDIWALEGVAAADVGADQLGALRRQAEHNRNAFLAYAPAPYAGPVDLLRATDPVPHEELHVPSGYLAGDRGWSRHAEVTTTDVSGHHFSLLDADHADALATTIRGIVTARMTSVRTRPGPRHRPSPQRQRTEAGNP